MEKNEICVNCISEGKGYQTLRTKEKQNNEKV